MRQPKGGCSASRPARKARKRQRPVPEHIPAADVNAVKPLATLALFVHFDLNRPANAEQMRDRTHALLQPHPIHRRTLEVASRGLVQASCRLVQRVQQAGDLGRPRVSKDVNLDPTTPVWCDHVLKERSVAERQHARARGGAVNGPYSH